MEENRQTSSFFVLLVAIAKAPSVMSLLWSAVAQGIMSPVKHFVKNVSHLHFSCVFSQIRNGTNFPKLRQICPQLLEVPSSVCRRNAGNEAKNKAFHSTLLSVSKCTKFSAKMNGFRFFKSKPKPTISFQNPIQIRWTDSFKIQILFKSKILSIVSCWRQNSFTKGK